VCCLNGSWSPWILDLGKVQGRGRLSLGWMPWLAGGFPNGSYDFSTPVGSVLICVLPVAIERGAFGGELLVWVGVCLPPFHSIREAWLLSSPGLIFRLIPCTGTMIASSPVSSWTIGRRRACQSPLRSRHSLGGGVMSHLAWPRLVHATFCSTWVATLSHPSYHLSEIPYLTG
jgi:hypothetical protein